MIIGFVNESDEPVVEVKLDLGKEKRLVNAVIDTGFNGYISVPKKLIDRSDWDFLGIEEYELASGELMRERVFLGRIEIGTEKLVAFILPSNSSDALIGTKLLKNRVLTINFADKTLYEKMSRATNPYENGKASKKIVETLGKSL